LRNDVVVHVQTFQKSATWRENKIV